MKKINILAGVVLAACGTAFAAPTGELRIAADMNNPPFTMIKQGKFEGFDIEIGNEVARRLNLRPIWSSVKFPDLILAIRTNKFDIAISSQGITEERKKVVEFTQPYFCGAMVLISKGEEPTLQNIKGKKVAVVQNTIYDAYATKNFPRQIVRVKDDKQVINALIFGKTEVGLMSRFVALQAEDKYKNIKVGEQLTREEAGMTVNKANTELLKKVNKALDDMVADGTYSKISKKFFGGDLSCK